MRVNSIQCVMLLTVVSSVAASLPPALAAEKQPDNGGILSIQMENDFFLGDTDRHFTHGTRLSYTTGERPADTDDLIAKAAGLVPFFPDQGVSRAHYALGQNIYTPADITDVNLIEDDRPYAGWLYLSAGLFSVSKDRDRMDNLAFEVGVIGPWSQAEKTQKTWHETFGFRDPKGWDHQLENEVGFDIVYNRSVRVWKKEFQSTGLEMDLVPNVGFSLGNVFTHANAGVTVRIGDDLSTDFSPPRIRPSLPGSDFFFYTRDLDWYLFASFGGRAVLRNIFLDGNTFTDSHRVDKKYLVGDLQAGAAITWRDWRLSYTHIIRTEEFHGQKDPDRFGAISLSYHF